MSSGTRNQKLMPRNRILNPGNPNTIDQKQEHDTRNQNPEIRQAPQKMENLET
jgi:hypothetical protein